MEDNKNEVVTDTESFDGDVPAILPDGWQEGDDLFAEEKTGLEDLAPADGQTDEEFLLSFFQNEGEAPASTTGETDGTDAGAKTEEQPDGATPAAPASRKLTLKVNHEEQTVDITAMSDDDLRALLQKGYAFDAMKDAEDRRTFLKVYQEQLDAGMTENVARLVAKDAAGRAFEVKDGQIISPETPQPQPPSQPAVPAPSKPTRDLRAEVEQLKLLYPDVREIPDEVAKKVASGSRVIDAYQAYLSQQSSKAAETLKKENKILRQNAANAQKAPVRGVSGGGVTPQKSDPFSEGFDAGWNWT